ncbi:uncharacterized protein isoform X1 [Rhodnius prolixus]|uniref:uncharacterized protein isoform X1 n=1 Tax=Rhodnius prolixus TaxID=13249 RepID=UPI003D189065
MKTNKWKLGYTPLHLATQFGHEEVCTQLIKVYKADENIRDYSGRKPRQYQKTSGTSISADTFRKIKARKKHAAEKDLRFLRIGSLNVRVKRTTEAFSNFLGVGNTDKLHKHWGSADNLPQANHKRMPPPKLAPIKKRKSKRGQDFNLKASTVEQHPAVPLSEQNPQDSDSDTAAGFGTAWQSTV